MKSKSDFKAHSLVVHIPYSLVVSEVSRRRACFSIQRACKHYSCSWVPSFILKELDTGRWGLKRGVRAYAVSCLPPLPPQQKVQIIGLSHLKVKMWSGGCVFLFLLIILAKIKSSASPFSPICRFPLFSSVRKHEFSLPLWPLGSLYSFFSFWSTWKVYSDIPPFFFYYSVPLSTLWCLCILFIDILLFSSLVICT